MKHIIRLDENDIVKIIQERFKVRGNQISALYDVDEEDDETKFYVEIEKDEKQT